MLMIGMPVHGNIDPRTTFSLIATTVDLQQRGLPWVLETILQDADIARARNTLLGRFQRSTATRFVFIDADMMWTPEDFRALLARDEDVVGAAYAKKSSRGELVGTPLENGDTRYPLLEAVMLGTGFLSISRRAIDLMIEAYPETTYREYESNHIAHHLFAGLVRDGRYSAEDETFCARWRAIEGRLWLHTAVRPGHIGTCVYQTTEVNSHG